MNKTTLSNTSDSYDLQYLWIPKSLVPCDCLALLLDRQFAGTYQLFTTSQT